MNKTSTSISKPTRGSERDVMVIKPKKATVELIKQFARAYAFSGMMPAGLGAFIANGPHFSNTHPLTRLPRKAALTMPKSTLFEGKVVAFLVVK